MDLIGYRAFIFKLYTLTVSKTAFDGRPALIRPIRPTHSKPSCFWFQIFSPQGNGTHTTFKIKAPFHDEMFASKMKAPALKTSKQEGDLFSQRFHMF